MALIPLSPIDHIFTGSGSYPIEFVFAYDGSVDADRLASSLEEALEHFAPVASKLVRLAEDAYGLEPSDDGLHFEVASSTATLSEAGARYGFLNPVHSVQGEPLTRIKLSQTPQGSVVGVSMSHAVADGFSYFHFLSSWARLFHRLPIHPPSHRRELLIPASTEPAKRLTSEDVLAECGVHWGERRSAIARERLRWHRYQFSREEMNEILSQAQRDCDVRLSHNDAITAWLWKRYVPAWSAGTTDSTALASCPVDFRRLLDGFPPTYFGCAVSLAIVSVDREYLSDAPLGVLAQKIRSTVAQVDADYVRKSLSVVERLRRQEGLSVLEHCHVIHPHSGILVTNLSRLPVHELEFDAGPPVAFDILTPAERGAVILPAADGADIRVCLPQETS
jgi:shikimate O-hydroxycinnamoyltransferase